MLLALLTLVGCDPSPIVTEPPTTCECTDPDPVTFQATAVGGFDDWGGAALVYAVDEAAGRVLVVAMNYETGVGQIAMEPACDEADALVGQWVVDVPDTAWEDVARWPLLGAALTTDAGVRSISQEVGAILLEGDLAASVPDRVHVSTGGNVTLLRGDGGGDTLQGALEFAALADGLPGHAEAACGRALRLGALDLTFASNGPE